MNRNKNFQLIVDSEDAELIVPQSYYAYEIVQFETTVNTIFDTFFNDNLNDLRIDTASILDSYGDIFDSSSGGVGDTLTFINDTYLPPQYDGSNYGDTETIFYDDGRIINWYWTNLSAYISDSVWDTANLTISGSTFEWSPYLNNWQLKVE